MRPLLLWLDHGHYRGLPRRRQHPVRGR